MRGAATARARLWRKQMHATWLRLPGVYPLKAHLVMLGILSWRWYSEFPSSECQYHPNIWCYVSKFHSERGYVWWVPVLVCFSGCFMPLCKSWALYKDHAFFRVRINEITKWIKDWADSSWNLRETKWQRPHQLLESRFPSLDLRVEHTRSWRNCDTSPISIISPRALQTEIS